MMRVQGYNGTVGMMSVPLRGEVALHTCAGERDGPPDLRYAGGTGKDV